MAPSIGTKINITSPAPDFLTDWKQQNKKNNIAPSHENIANPYLLNGNAGNALNNSFWGPGPSPLDRISLQLSAMHPVGSNSYSNLSYS